MALYKNLFPALLLVLLASSCEKIMPAAPAEDEILDGPVSGLSGAEHARFLQGDIAFNDDVFTAETGLGPLFVANSCGSCHAGDGKGHPFTMLTRFGQNDSSGNKFLHAGGPQLQHRAIPGFQPEQLPAQAPVARFLAPANTGLGYLAALSDAQILALADPNDANGDGISGVPNYVSPPPYFTAESFHQPWQGKYIGRFGKKAGAITLLHQTVNAYKQDMGVVSAFDPIDTYSGQEGDPEVSSQKIADLVFYLRTLKAPIQRTPNDPVVQNGKTLFMQINCGKCHVPEFTSPASDIAALSNQTFYPYTDLLLHDMGAELDDGYTEGNARTYEWRTAPLWGLGLASQSQGGSIYLMHDGRAGSIEAAILLHGGEAAASRQAYLGLDAAQKKALIKFLESL